MIATLIFCLCVTGLSCYTVHVLVQERKEYQSAIYQTIQEIDQRALARELSLPLVKVEAIQKQKMLRPTREVYDMPVKNEKACNQYPIKSTPQSGTGYGFDVYV